MAAHQSIVATLCVKVQGIPTNRPAGTATSRVGRHVIPAGTPGLVSGVEPANPWDTDDKIYHFFPANYSKTTARDVVTPDTADGKRRIVILAEAVEYHQNEGDEDGPVVHIPIVEAGYTRITSLFPDPAGLSALARCRLVFDRATERFVLKQLDGSAKNSVDNWYAGRLLTAQPTSSPLFFSTASPTVDVEFFRQRPIEFKSAALATAGALGTGGSLGTGGQMFTNPALSDSD